MKCRFGNYDLALGFFDLDDAVPPVKNQKEFLANLKRVIPTISTKYEDIFR
jgi:hypothetical protein